MAYIPPNPNGAATTANSQPVNIASDQTVPVSLATDLDTSSTGTLAAAAQTVVLSMASKSAASVIVTGTWVGTITFEGTVDGTNWSSINAVAATTSQPQPTTTVNGLYRLTPAGLLQMRANMTAFTSGSASIGMRASAGTGGVFVNQILPSKITDGISTAAIKAASTPAVAADQAVVVAISPNNTVPVSGTVSANATLAAETTKVIGTVNIAAAQTLATVTTVSAVTAITNALPTGANTIGAISNTAFIANAGTNLNTSALALDATFTGGTARVKITDGTNNASVKAASTPAVAADPALVIQLSPMNAQAASLIVSTTGAASAAVTATLPAAGAGLFHYIVRINIIKYASVATVGSATPTIVTTTNMSGSLAWTTPTSLAVGTQYETDINSSAPIKSSVANTATTIVCPLTTSIIWRVNVYYYTAP